MRYIAPILWMLAGAVLLVVVVYFLWFSSEAAKKRFRDFALGVAMQKIDLNEFR